MSGLIIVIILLGIGVSLALFLIIRSLVAPKKIANLAALVKQNKLAAAIRMAKKILAHDGRNADAHYFLGLAYLGENKAELALMELRLVNQLGQFSEYCKENTFRRQIAELFVRFNQPEEALKEYLLLIKREPNAAVYHSAIGRLFEERGRTDKAMLFYKKAVDLDPRDSEAHYRFAVLLYKAHRIPEARSEFEAATKLDPENYPAHFYLGRFLKENHDYAAALTSFEKAQKDPEFKVKALVERGACFMSMNNFDRAVAELERALKLSTDDRSQDVLYGRYFLSLCHEKNRNIEMAIDQWEKIYEKNPNFRDVPEKLSQYQEFRQDDRIKDFMTVGQDEFLEMCKSASVAMGLTIQDISSIQNGCQVVAVENQTKWRNTRKIPRLIRFLRVAEMIDESTVRSLQEEMKKQNVLRGVLVTSSTFSRLAMDFAESRPVELYDKDKLRELLKAGNTGEARSTPA